MDINRVNEYKIMFNAMSKEDAIFLLSNIMELLDRYFVVTASVTQNTAGEIADIFSGKRKSNEIKIVKAGLN